MMILHALIGVGLRVQTPLGPIRLDYGHGDQTSSTSVLETQF